MNFDTILKAIQRTSIVGFMLSAFFIVVGDYLIKALILSVSTLYLFIGTTYINQMRKNGVNNEKVTQQIIGIVLGTVLLIVVITGLFKTVIAITNLT